MKVGKTSHSFETKMDMTPLIDCVFLLIMFFILTTQITVQVEDITLPFAIEGKPPPPEGAPTVILNVVRKAADAQDRSAEIIYNGEGYTTVEQLREILQREADLDNEKRGGATEFTPDGKPLSQLEILIRADKDARGEYMRTIFEACALSGIYKLKLSSEQPTGG